MHYLQNISDDFILWQKVLENKTVRNIDSTVWNVLRKSQARSFLYETSSSRNTWDT